MHVSMLYILMCTYVHTFNHTYTPSGKFFCFIYEDSLFAFLLRFCYCHCCWHFHLTTSMLTISETQLLHYSLGGKRKSRQCMKFDFSVEKESYYLLVERVCMYMHSYLWTCKVVYLYNVYVSTLAARDFGDEVSFFLILMLT